MRNGFATSGPPAGDSCERSPLDGSKEGRKRVGRHDLESIETANLRFELRKEKLVKVMSTVERVRKGDSVAFAMNDKRVFSGPEWTAKCLGEAASM